MDMMCRVVRLVVKYTVNTHTHTHRVYVQIQPDHIDNLISSKKSATPALFVK